MITHISENMIKKEISNILKDKSLTVWFTFNEDDKYDWAIVCGWIEEPGFNGIGIKTAFHSKNNMMYEYNYDWMMPYDLETREVDDTECSFEYTNDQELINEICDNITYFNNNINRFNDSYVNKWTEEK